MVVRTLIGISGAALVVASVLSAFRTFVVPRATRSIQTRLLFLAVWRTAERASRSIRDRRRADRFLSFAAPLSLVVLPGAWAGLVLVGFAGVYVAVDGVPLSEAVVISGSSLLTLGFAQPPSTASTLLSFAEALMGLGLVALAIAYLPSIYAAFNRREVLVALLETLAGAPPSPHEMLIRHHVIGALDRLDTTWERWQHWFADVEESHTSISALCFFRSPQPETSWVVAAGCILDAAALTVSCLEVERRPEAELLLRSGYVTLRRISDVVGLPYDPAPEPSAATTITRADFDGAWAAFEANGLPLKADRDAAWRAYNGWRVNYDSPLVRLAALTVAPPAAWSSDRSLPPVAPRWSVLRRR